MTFTKFVCWDLNRVRRVMNVEATQPLDHLFLATHHPVAMYRQELIEAPSAIPYDEEQFLKDFLAEEDFAFVPVLGSSGTGKSHLIRWLKANIESTNKRKVLLIPKIGTNLKDIISLILEGMEGAHFDEYRQRLNRASSTLTEALAREQLLNQLAAAVGDNGKRDRAQLSEEQNYLVDELNSLLYDPFFRQHWLRDGGIIHRLVIHTLGHRDTVEIIEERCQFAIADLPLNVLDLQKASNQAREFYSLLIGDDEIQKATVEWLNSHLDEAIAQVLNLEREDLQRLMREVREILAEQGIELLLLIEDFAKFQGIDREVLEAVLARPQQPGRKSLCAIRTALACTTGYFQGLIDTVRQRVTFSVNLDIGTVSNQSLITLADISQFVARYLNAVRLEDETITNWANSRNQEDYEGETLASACGECEHRLACHAGFKEVNGIGLYPFTPEALEQMLGRVNKENFNPRILIKDVLKWTLENSKADIEQGRFPSVSVGEHFGNVRLSAILQDDIIRQDTQNYIRRQILLDLWTDSTTLIDLSAEIHTAFDIPPLGVSVQQAKTISVGSTAKESPSAYQTSKKVSPDKTGELTAGVPAKLTESLTTLDNWNNQSILLQDIARELREFIFPAIVERIEWDTEMLLQGTFASNSSKVFKQRNVVFHSPKVTRETIAGIRLSLPLNPNDPDEFRETAIAFQGILQYSYYKHWRFPNGDRHFCAYARQLERWSQYVLEQIRLYPREEGEPWNPVPAAVELLAIAATMTGHPINSIENLVNALFLDLESNDEENRAATWKKLLTTFKKHRESLLEIITSRVACRKGKSKDFQIIDAVQIIDTLKQVSKSWKPQCQIPDDVRENFPEIDKTRQQVDELLERAIQEECDRQFAVYQLFVANLGENVKKEEVINVIKQAMDRAREAGVFGTKNADNLTIVLDNFKGAAIAKYIEAMKRLQAESNSGDKLPHLSGNHQKAMSAICELLNTANQFIDSSLKRAGDEVENLQSGEGKTVESIHQAILADLTNLRNLITEIKG